MEIQRIKLMDKDGVTAETIANLTQYPPHGWGARFPIHTRGSLKAPISLRRVPQKEQYGSSAKDSVYDLIISRDAYPSIARDMGLWCYDEWAWYDFFTIEDFKLRVPRNKVEFHELNNFMGWSSFVAHCFVNIIQENKRHPLYSFKDYKGAADFYRELNLVLECGNVDVLLTDGGVLYVFDKGANPLGHFRVADSAIRHMQLKQDEQLNIKFKKDFVREHI